MTPRTAAILLAALPLPATAQEAGGDLTCTLAVICVEANECQAWGQEIALREGQDGGWQIDWDADLTTDYAVAADLPAPDGALEPTRMRSLLYSDPDMQTVQMVSLDEANGNIVVTMHQPHLRPRAVTGFGLCTEAGGEAAAPVGEGEAGE